MICSVPHCATGITGHPVISANRAAPVLATIGQRAGSFVVVPSGIDDHHLALVDGRYGRAQRLGGGGFTAVHRDLLRPAHQAPEDGDPEDALLGQEVRRETVVPQEVRQGGRVKQA